MARQHLGQEVRRMPSGARDEALAGGTFRKPRAVFEVLLPAAVAGIRNEVGKTGNMLKSSRYLKCFARCLVQS